MDLLILSPMGSWTDFFGAERAARRQRWRAASEAALAKVRDSIAWQEDVFVYGPPLPEVRDRFTKAGYFHVEMFVALPGRQAELVREREMENAYDKALGLPDNLIFAGSRRDQDLLRSAATATSSTMPRRRHPPGRGKRPQAAGFEACVSSARTCGP